MKCGELMKTDVECCKADELVEEVASRMRIRNIGFVPICDASGAVVGTLTDRDLVVRVLADGRPTGSTRAREVMSTDVISCNSEDNLSVAEELMSKYKISRIICIDDSNRPVGVISLSDIAKTETGGKASAILRSVAQREARV